MTSQHPSGRHGFQSTPSNQLFDFRLLSEDDGHAEILMPLKATYLQEEGVVHGGIISSLADTAAVYAILPALVDGEGLTSIEFKVNFLRSVHVDAGDLRARAHVVKRGRTIALVDVDVVQQEHLVAKGLFTYLIFDKQQ